MTPWLLLLLHAALVALAAPTLAGLLRGTPAQPWRDLIRLARKPGIRPAAASFVFAAAPPLSLGAAAAAALLVPSFSLGMATAPAADLVVVAGLLALSRLAPALAAFDASATQTFATTQITAARIAGEPVLLLAALATVLMSGGTNLEAAALRDGLPGLRLPGLLAGFALLAVVAAEPRSPAIFSGRPLALMTAATHLRLVAGLSLVMAVGLPFGLAPPAAGLEAWLVGAACWALKLGVLAALAAVLAPHRVLMPAAALLALIAAVILGAQATV
jgi:formate hydrogenlyase subunit 4